MKLLRIDSSPRAIGSHSKELADMLESKFKAAYTNLDIIRCDLSSINLPHITQEYIEATFVPKEDRTSTLHDILSLADSFIADIKSADAVLLSVPLYNFNVPSTPKAYIDYISRPGETFSINESGYTGLITGKKLIITAAYGADFSQMKDMDFMEPYLKSFFGFLGFIDITYVAIEGTIRLNKDVVTQEKISLIEGIKV